VELNNGRDYLGIATLTLKWLCVVEPIKIASAALIGA
jgi:hypothetical protein